MGASRPLCLLPVIQALIVHQRIIVVIRLDYPTVDLDQTQLNSILIKNDRGRSGNEEMEKGS